MLHHKLMLMNNPVNKLEDTDIKIYTKEVEDYKHELEPNIKPKKRVEKDTGTGTEEKKPVKRGRKKKTT